MNNELRHPTVTAWPASGGAELSRRLEGRVPPDKPGDDGWSGMNLGVEGEGVTALILPIKGKDSRHLVLTPKIQPHTPSRLITTRGPAWSGRGWRGNGASWMAGLTHGTDKTAIRGSKSAEVWLQYPPGLEYPSRGGRKSPSAGRLAVSLTISLATMPRGVPHPSYRQVAPPWRSWRLQNRIPLNSPINLMESPHGIMCSPWPI